MHLLPLHPPAEKKKSVAECEEQFSSSFLHGAAQTDCTCSRSSSACCRQKSDVLLDIYFKRHDSQIFLFPLTYRQSVRQRLFLFTLVFLLQPVMIQQHQLRAGNTSEHVVKLLIFVPESKLTGLSVGNHTGNTQETCCFLFFSLYMRNKLD